MSAAREVSPASGAGTPPSQRVDRLGRRLTVAMVIFSSVVTAVITAIQLYADYRNDIDRIEESFSFIRESYLNVLIDSVWTANDGQIQAQLDGLLRLRDMEYLAITVNDQPRWTAGAPHSQRTIESEVELLRLYRDKPVPIGRLRLVASADNVLARVADKLLLVLLENAVKTTLVAGFVSWLFRNMVTRHLARLARFADDMQATGLAGPALRLERPLRGRWRPDVLDTVVDAVNAMRSTLAAAYDDLRRTAEQLAQSEQRFRVLVSNVPGVIYRGDLRSPFHLHFVSEGVSRLSGHSAARFTGATAITWAGLILPADRRRVAQEIRRAVAERRPYVLEYRICHADGGLRWVGDHGRPAYGADDQPAWIDSVVVDISARKQAEIALQRTERKLSLHLQQSIVGIIEWDTDFRVAEWNPAAEHIFGYTRAQAMGRVAKDLILPREVLPVIDTVWADLLQRSGGTYSNNRNLTSDGRVISCEWFNTALTNDDDQVVGVMSLVRDVTARERTESELRVYRNHLEELVRQRTLDLERAKDLAETASRAKSAFVANISHELRTPLNAVLGFSSLLLREALAGREPLSATQREHLMTVRRSGEHLLTLINNVLELSRIETGGSVVNLGECDLDDLLVWLQQMFALKAGDKGLALRCTRAPETPRQIRTDEVKLRQVLINLIGNACKFTERGSVSLHVDLASPAAADDDRAPGAPTGEVRLRFAVADSGPGIAADELPGLFQAFAQSATGRQAAEGSGLGLALCRHFVDLLGGRIEARSTVGKGSVFTFDIPLAAVTRPTPVLASEKRLVRGLQEGQPIYRLLVVDDDDDNRRLLVRVLAPLGFAVKEAGDGQEALRLWESWQPHLIWMDMRMPGVDGGEVTRRIKATARGRETKVLALTASSYAEERADILAAGCDDFLAKPFREAELLAAIERHLGVRYVLDEPADAPTSPRPMDPDALLEALRALPDDWLGDLERAAVRAEMGLVATLLERIATVHPALAADLARRADDFDYGGIATLVDAAMSPSGDRQGVGCAA